MVADDVVGRELADGAIFEDDVVVAVGGAELPLKMDAEVAECHFTMGTVRGAMYYDFADSSHVG